MKKILIIGSKGMAGHVIYHYLRDETDFQIIDIARDTNFHKPTYQLDVSDFRKLRDAEDHPDKAILLNAYLPHFLAQRGGKIKFKLIHISTDCVFSGSKGGYTEDSPKDGIGFYAQSKALGEVTYGSNLTLRTSIIGPELNSKGIGLFHWFMNQKGTIKGYKQAYWTGVSTLELAKAIKEAIDQDITGLHHLVNSEKISKYDLISIFKQVFARNELDIMPSDDYRVDKSLIRCKNTFNYQVSSYRTMVSEMKDWINSHPLLYKYL